MYLSPVRHLSVLIPLTALLSGCIDDPTALDYVGEDLDDDELAILSFDSDVESITQGASTAGQVVLEWNVHAAEEVHLFGGDEVITIDDCQSPQDVSCLADHSVSLSPDEATVYRLRAWQGEDCSLGDNCLEEELSIQVYPPAEVSLDVDDDRFVAGDDVIVDYSTTHALDWEIGIADGDELTEVCGDDPNATCRLDTPEEGQLRLVDLQETTTLSATATNGADDRLGDLAVGDVALTLFPLDEPVIRSLVISPENARFGDTVTLHWETEDADRVELTADPELAFSDDLDHCSEVDDQGHGHCEAALMSSGNEFVDIEVSATAFDQSDASQPLTSSMSVGFPPSIDDFSIQSPEDAFLEDDLSAVLLSWTIGGEPTSMTLTENGHTVLDALDGINALSCTTNEGQPCNLDADSLWRNDIQEPTEYILTAQNAFGTCSQAVTVSVDDYPYIDELKLDDFDLLDEIAVIFQSTDEIEWYADDTETVLLEQAPGSIDDLGCASDDLQWSIVNPFPIDDDDDDMGLSGIDDHVTCYRFSAYEDEDGPRAIFRFPIVRGPELDTFSIDPPQTSAGGEITLHWDTRFANRVEIDSDNDDLLVDGTLHNCTDVDQDGAGSCQILIDTEASGETISFDARAYGFDDYRSDRQSVELTVGQAPVIDTFCVVADSADDGDCQSITVAADESDDIELEWAFDGGDIDGWTITDDEGTVIAEEQDQDGDEDGDITLEDISSTTTWTLSATNQFGSHSHEVTAFFGPAFPTLTINGEDATHGPLSQSAGSFVIQFEAQKLATFEDLDNPPLELMVADADGSSCPQSSSDWSIIDISDDGSSSASDAMTSFSGEASLTERASNFCVQLSATNDQPPAQSSSLTARVITNPEAPSALSVTPDTIDPQVAQTISLSADYGFGTTSLVVRAHFTGSGVVDHLADCDLSDLDGQPGAHACEHTMSGAQCLAGYCIYDPPAFTEFIHYEVCAYDVDGNRACARDADDATVSLD